MIFQQLFEPLSHTYTYLIACEETGVAALVDPVVPTMDRDLERLEQLELKLVLTIDTHLHADHITSARHLREKTDCLIAFPGVDNLPCADVQIEDDVALMVGKVAMIPLFTPGHTDDHFCFLMEDRLLTGDCLLIDGCGRTDFQNGDAAQLYTSITERLYKLPDDTLIYPGHDYQGRFVSTIAQEKARNPRVNEAIDEQQFIKIMSELGLPYPNFIDYAVPGNKLCGECPSDLPEKMDQYCAQMTESSQG
jgi:sulfur dioxygenase